MIYARVHNYGSVPSSVQVLTVGSGSQFSMTEDPSGRIETAGNPFSVRIRPESPGVPKAMIVSDGIAGLRLYVEED